MKRRNVAEQMFNDVINTIRESQGDLERTISGYTSGGSTSLLVDVIEGIDDVTVKVDLPGVKKENVTLYVNEDSLEVDALFDEETSIEGDNYVKRERKQGEVRRVISLPTKISIDEANAAFENGVLIVTLPKIGMKEAHTVNVD